jgi:hypothetical protein
VFVPESISEIPDFAFHACCVEEVGFASATTLRRIEFRSFSGTSLRAFSVPASVESIAEGAFFGCSDLVSVAFAPNSRLMEVCDFVFGETALGFFEIPSSLIRIESLPLGVRVALPHDSRFRLEDGFLIDCGNRAIRYLGRETVVVPESVEALGRDCIEKCFSVRLPPGLRRIAAGAFCCESGRVVFPESLEFVHGAALAGVDEIETTGDRFHDTGLFLLDGPTLVHNYAVGQVLELPLAVREIGPGGFFEQRGIGRIVCDLEAIHERAFCGCSLTALSTGSRLRFIGEGAFSFSELGEISLRRSEVRIIPRACFYGAKLTRVSMPPDLEAVREFAFAHCESLSRVSFGRRSGVRFIGPRAFSSSGLASVELPASVSEIGKECFFRCVKLKSVDFDGVSQLRSIREGAFAKSGLKAFAMPGGIREISPGAFPSGCRVDVPHGDSALRGWAAERRITEWASLCDPRWVSPVRASVAGEWSVQPSTSHGALPMRVKRAPRLAGRPFATCVRLSFD